MKGWETYKKQYNQCSQCWENCNSLQKRVVIQLSRKNHERSNFIRRSSKRLLLGIFLPLCERNWWAIGAENDYNIFRWKLFFFFCSLSGKSWKMLALNALCWRSQPEIIKDNKGSGKFFEDEMTRYFSANRLVSILSSKLLQVSFCCTL